MTYIELVEQAYAKHGFKVDTESIMACMCPHHLLTTSKICRPEDYVSGVQSCINCWKDDICERDVEPLHSIFGNCSILGVIVK